MKNLTFWEHPSYCISDRNKIQSFRLGSVKGFSFRIFLTGLGLITLISGCGPVPEETAHQKALKDSAAADSIMRLEANKIKKYESAKKKFSDSVKLALKAQQQRKADSLTDSTELRKLSLPIHTPNSIDSPKLKKHKVLDSTQKKPRKKLDSLHRKTKIRRDTV